MNDGMFTTSSEPLVEPTILRFQTKDRANITKEDRQMLIEHGVLPVFVDFLPQIVTPTPEAP